MTGLLIDAALPCFVMIRCGSISGRVSQVQVRCQILTTDCHEWLDLPTVYTFSSPFFKFRLCGMKF